MYPLVLFKSHMFNLLSNIFGLLMKNQTVWHIESSAIVSTIVQHTHPSFVLNFELIISKNIFNVLSH